MCYLPGNCLPALLLWEACEPLSLAECLTAGAAWGLIAWETLLSAWERVLSAREAGGLPAWETELSAWERALSAWEACLTITWGEAWLPACELEAICRGPPVAGARVACLFATWVEALAAGVTWELCQVIFPLFSKLLNFLTCLSLTFLNLNSLTFSKVLFFSYPSDLMKSTVVDESLSSTKLQFCSRENQLATIITTE